VRGANLFVGRFAGLGLPTGSEGKKKKGERENQNTELRARRQVSLSIRPYCAMNSTKEGGRREGETVSTKGDRKY